MVCTYLGTGHGSAKECYNTCFTLNKDNYYFLVDTGGGNGILKQLMKANIKIEDIRVIFISHSHLDHILGIIWIIRILAKGYFKKEYKKKVCIYGNDNVIKTVKQLIKMFIPKDFLLSIAENINIVEVMDGEEVLILNNRVKFFDIKAVKIIQFGFTMWINENERLTFIGDEVCSSYIEKDYVKNTKWLIGDAYMAGDEAEKYNPIKKHRHSTVKFISELSERLDVKNIILSHTIDNNLDKRKEIFLNDSKKYFSGNIFIPDDLEKILID
ncbi:MAG: MBL fold metallo-hydrolase [Clostridia bacterium]|nr:MBL fold metallo-hydrolase [Clostridia bacterium]